MSSNFINVYYQPIADIPMHIYRQMYKLNAGSNGCMRDMLVASRRFADERNQAMAFYIKGKDDVIKGWAYVDHPYGRKHEVHFWVKASERRQGYGTALATVVKQVFKGKRVVGYQDNSSLFKRHRIRDIWGLDNY